MDIRKPSFEDLHDIADLAKTVTRPNHPASLHPGDSEEALTETSKYYVESIEQARRRAEKLAAETSRRSGLVQKEIDELSANTDHVTSFRASGEFRRLKERVCNAERNVVIERDRYARLLARYTALSERHTDDVKRTQSLQQALSEYQEINETLAEQLEQQGSTLERLVLSMRRARDELSGNARPVAEPDLEAPASADYVVWSKHQLQSAVEEANQMLEDFDEVWDESADIGRETFPMAKRDPA